MFVTTLLLLAHPAIASTSAKEGVGTTLVQRHILQTTAADCSARYPALKARLESQLADWLEANSDKIRAADEIVVALPAESREALDHHLENATASFANLMTAASKQGVGEKFCEEAILELGSNLETGSYDADNLDEAVGMYNMMVLSEEFLAPRCIQIAPEARADIESARAKWFEREAKIQLFVKARSEAILERQPKLREDLRKQVSAQLDTGFELLAKQGPQVAGIYCKNEYFEFAEDKKRLKTPKMYQFLESAVR